MNENSEIPSFLKNTEEKEKRRAAQITSPEQLRLSSQALKSIANFQKGLLVSVLISLLFVFAYNGSVDPSSDADPIMRWVYAVAALIFTLFAVGCAVCLCVKTLPHSMSGFLTIVICIIVGSLTMTPCISLLVLGILDHKAKVILQRHGLKVDFLGVSSKELKKLEPQEILD